MSSYKLIYYDLDGAGEFMRYLFALAKVKYEDYRIPKNKDTYPKLPADIKKDLPWGQIPILEVDGKPIAQIAAIIRFLAKRFGFTGTDDLEDAKCDELFEVIKDFGTEFHKALYNPIKDEDREEVLEKLTKAHIPYFMTRFEKIAKDNGSGKYLVGRRLTWIDVVMAHSLKLIINRTGIPLLKDYPVLNNVVESFYDLPEIKEWIASRPDSDQSGSVKYNFL